MYYNRDGWAGDLETYVPLDLNVHPPVKHKWLAGVSIQKVLNKRSGKAITLVIRDTVIWLPASDAAS